jgi:hypothetical protein
MIYNTDTDFSFDQLILKNPIQFSTGVHFIKYNINDAPLYIKTPKCHIKTIAYSQLQNKKKINCDLQFLKEDEDIILWFDNLETYTRKTLYDNREKWFDSELELQDIENLFIPSLKSYKSGKQYLIRTIIPMKDDMPNIKIYDEDENEINIDDLKENTEITTIMECKGVKCSSKNFIIDIELKQILIHKEKNLFEKCILTKSKDLIHLKNSTYAGDESSPKLSVTGLNILEKKSHDLQLYKMKNTIIKEDEEKPLAVSIDHTPINEEISKSYLGNNQDIEKCKEEKLQEVTPETSELCEVDFNLEEIIEVDSVQLKKRNEVYYELYREARRKAKVARDLALSAYLEAKRIKNTYMLDNLRESDESDNEFDEEENSDNEE